jgi:hypothetical protein
MRAAIYVLVVAINLNELFMPAWIHTDHRAPFDALTRSSNDHHSSGLSLFMTSGLSLMVLFGYWAVIYNSAATEVPMVIRAVDRCNVQVAALIKVHRLY